ncbi:unnamed protein product [Rotaria sordida]|uniref:Uncharacterized protein n=1 Tax=Rotaria sordida TaxID=392033 RepID=A0A814B7J7_9BILA|nr:unnamed protein product [Rotaria sordida]CAF0962943.1 unnamed protein product [Rotaria sordida]
MYLRDTYCFVFIAVCQCNQTLNLLARSEYFQLDTNVDDGQLILTNLFTPPHILTLIRSNSTVPTLTVSLIKGSVDLMSIGVGGGQSGEFNAYITFDSSLSNGTTTIGPIKSSQGVIKQCFLRVNIIKLEFSDLPISTSKQDVPIDLVTCEHTLPCNCTPLYDIMRDSNYLGRIEVSETSEQLNTLRDMIIRNNKTGFQFNPSATPGYFRVYFKKPISIALVQILTPQSNVKQIRLSYLDHNNQTIKNPALQGWQVNHVSQLGRENNSLDKLCPNFLFHGIQVDLLQTDPSSSLVHNATLKVYIRTCDGTGGRIRLCAEANIMHRQNLELYRFITPECFSDMAQAYENLRGENCRSKNPEVLIKFQPLSRAYISKVEVQRRHTRSPANIRQIQAVFFDTNNSLILDEVTGEPIRWISPENEPVISGDFQDVGGLIVKVLKTDNDENLRGFRVKLMGCYSTAKLATYIIEETTTQTSSTISSVCPDPIDLMANPSNKINSMNLNGEDVSNVTSISSLSSGLTAKSGNTLKLLTNFTKPIEGITSIGLINSPNVVGPIRYQLYDGLGTLIEVNGTKIGEIVSINAEHIEQMVITTNLPTNDGQPPRNLKLVLNGCFNEAQLATKAQIEDNESTTIQATTTIAPHPVCRDTNLLGREHVKEYSSNDVMSDLSNAHLFKRGVTFPVSQPNITIKFLSDVIVTKMYTQVHYLTHTSNIRQICVTLYNNNSTPLTYPNGTVVPLLKSPLDNPVIEGWFEGVNSMRVQLCDTNDGLPPKRFRFGVFGCYSSQVTYILLSPTEYPGQQTTTPPLFCLNDRQDAMLDPSEWFENATINSLSLPAFDVVSLSQFKPNSGGVTFDSRSPLPTIDLIPRGQRGSFATLGFNYNPKQATNIQSGQIILTLKEGTKQVYSLYGPDNLLITPNRNYDVRKVSMQILNTTDGQPAKNVEIIVYACLSGNQSLFTPSTTKEPCIPINLADRSLMASVTSPDSNISDLAPQIVSGSTGVSSFISAQPEITFLYGTQHVQTLYDIRVPTENSNVRQIETSYIALPDGSKLLTDSKGDVIRNLSPLNDPTVKLDPPREGIYGFKVKVLSTSDNSTPRNVTVIANGCQKSSATATTPNPFYHVPRACPDSVSLLSAPESYIQSIKADTEVINKDKFQDITTTGYTFPSNATKYSITVEFRQPLTVDRMGILQGTNGTNVDVFHVILNQSPERSKYSGHVGELIVANTSDTDQSARLTFHIKNTTDGQPPRNVLIYIEGCNFSTLQTKAQIEEQGSTTKSATWCPVKSIMHPENMAEYYSPDALSDLSEAYEFRRGVSFPLSQTPTIRAYFNAPVSISTVALVPIHKHRISNIIKYSLYYITWDNQPYIDPTTGKVLNLTTADGDLNLTIQHELINNLKGLNLTILKTSGGTPTWFRLKVLGCYKPSVTYFIPMDTITSAMETTTSAMQTTTSAMQTTTTAIQTTSTPKKCENLTDLTQMSNTLFSKVIIQNQTQTSSSIPSPLVVNQLPFQIDIDFAREVDIEQVRFVNGDQSKISQIGVMADVMNDYVNSTSPTLNAVLFPSTIEYVSHLTVKLNNTIDNSLPNNLKLEILGCYIAESELFTKAQIEMDETTMHTELMGSTTSDSSWCSPTNILTPGNMQTYSSPAAPFSDFSRAYENMQGEKLTEEPYIINAFFSNPICVSEVRVQQEAPRYKPSNIAKIEVSYKTSDKTDLKTSDGNKIVLQSPDDNATVIENQLRCNVQGVDVKILKTTDENKPSFVRVMVLGCNAPISTMLPSADVSTTMPTSSIITTQQQSTEQTSITGSTTPMPECTTPVEMIRSNDQYFSPIISDGVKYEQPPFPKSFNMTKSTMKIEFYTPEPTTMTSVSVLNPNESQITQMTVETDYGNYTSTNLQGLQVNFTPNIEFNTRLIITLTTTMSDVTFPKEVKLAIYGCGEPYGLATKAQIEDMTTESNEPTTIIGTSPTNDSESES